MQRLVQEFAPASDDQKKTESAPASKDQKFLHVYKFTHLYNSIFVIRALICVRPTELGGFRFWYPLPPITMFEAEPSSIAPNIVIGGEGAVFEPMGFGGFRFWYQNPVHISVNRSTLFLRAKGGLSLADREEGWDESSEAGLSWADLRWFELIRADLSGFELIWADLS